jgi:hypothetical protein
MGCAGVIGVLIVASLIASNSPKQQPSVPSEPTFANGYTAAENRYGAKAMVQRRLKDPESARFGAIWVKDVENTTYVCGSVNAKNSFGGYSGEHSFIADSYYVIFPTDGRAAFVKKWDRVCK